MRETAAELEAVVKSLISRRSVLGGPLALAGCGVAASPYFGKTDPPQQQKLVVVLGVEPGSLDPATSAELIEERVIYALFEGLTTLHPLTGKPMAGLATHYETTPDACRYTFYLRAHPAPRGIRFANRDNLPAEYRRGLPAAPDSRPAKWSDGVRLTAHDFVYSWRRVVDPFTAAGFAYLISYIVNAEKINSGKLPPESLAIRAIDDHTVQVDLRVPAPFFLELAACKWLCPVPRHVVQRAGKAWTEAGRMVTSGAFTLCARRAGEKLLLARNRYYYEADCVALEQLVFLPVMDAATSANLYRTAEAAMAPTTATLVPLVHRKKDYRATPVFGTSWATLRTAQPPFDDLRVRHALNMATDKKAIAEMVPGQTAAITLTPPMKGYDVPGSLSIPIRDSTLDVLAFNPRGARELLESAIGRTRLRTTFTHPAIAEFQFAGLILQQQWRQTLGVDLELVLHDVATWVQATFDRAYPGILANGDASPYVDPSYLLEEFTASGASGSDWSDAEFDAMVANAGSTPDPEARLQKLAECESRLLAAMPVVPLTTFLRPSLAKPYIRGLGNNPLDRQQFKYVWIDQNWRPS
ncbi:MAG TPA: peptide ABC transporter substrate-binding protein [Bryobacteraceae bacterium]|nr:peptide ABC transporter substrate-binding protein [Bryobacteraceae bacterium]